jgi:putative hydrolase of the HAD superfamily
VSPALDAVTVDALGTLVELDDPTETLRAALAARGVERSASEAARAFALEAEYYKSRVGEPGRWDDGAVAAFRRDCTGVFLSALSAPLDPDAFTPEFVDALRFRLIAGSDEALGALRGAGLVLACVSNWDPTLHERLEELGVRPFFAVVVTSAEAGAAKPDPRIFRVALARLGTAPARTLHVGDSEVDRDGALAAGLAFAPAPLVTLPRRLGIE